MNMPHAEEHQELSPRRRRSRARRTERLVGAAMDLIAGEGFDALTMTRLADELDLSVGALYRYFSSKDALIAELQRRAIATIQEQLTQARAQRRPELPSDPAVAACAELLATADFYLGLARQQPRLYRLVAATLADPRLLVDDTEAAAVAPQFAGLLAEVAGLFEAADRAGALEPGHAMQRCVAYWTALHGVTLVGKLERLAPKSADAGWFASGPIGLELAATLLRGWGAAPETLDRARTWLDRSDSNKETPP